MVELGSNSVSERSERRARVVCVCYLPPLWGLIRGVDARLVRRLAGTGLPVTQGAGESSQHYSFMRGTANCEAIRVSEAKPNGIFPATPSRCGRCVCFGRRVHESFVCELPPLWRSGWGIDDPIYRPAVG
jgi:hypothetical protein